MAAVAVVVLAASVASGDHRSRPSAVLDPAATSRLVGQVWQEVALELARPAQPSRALFAFAGALADAARIAGPVRQWPIALRPLPRLTADPVKGVLTSSFGMRDDPFNGRRRRHHSGLDIDAERGEVVRAAGAGIVIKAERYYGYGRVVFIDHGLGLVTRYGHLETIDVKQGDVVPVGARIGSVGSSGRATGPHLHFEVRVDDRPIDPSRVMDTELIPGYVGVLDGFVRLLESPTGQRTPAYL